MYMRRVVRSHYFFLIRLKFAHKKLLKSTWFNCVLIEKIQAQSSSPCTDCSVSVTNAGSTRSMTSAKKKCRSKIAKAFPYYLNKFNIQSGLWIIHRDIYHRPNIINLIKLLNKYLLISETGFCILAQ